MKQETFRDWINQNLGIFLIILVIFSIIVQLSNYSQNTKKLEEVQLGQGVYLDSITSMKITFHKLENRHFDDSIRMVTMVKLMMQQTNLIKESKTENQVLRKRIKEMSKNELESN